MPLLSYTGTQAPQSYSWTLPGSKSLSHRYLIAKELYAPYCQLHNLSNSTDTQALQKAMQQPSEVHFEDGATPMRFFMALAAARSWASQIDAGLRLRERPLQPLLELLGHDEELHFPICLNQTLEPREKWIISTQESSQFLSALLLVAPFVHGKGNTCHFYYPQGFPSKPYADMTLHILEEFGISHHLHEDQLSLTWNHGHAPSNIWVEPDWSSAAFAYNMCLALPDTSMYLPGLKLNSWQGDSFIHNLYRDLGIDTTSTSSGVVLSRIEPRLTDQAALNLSAMPDAAPALACAYAFCKRPVSLYGLDNLKLKESDRVAAIMENLEALGIASTYEDGTLNIQPCSHIDLPKAIIQTRQDHRIAMAFALFAKRQPLQYSETQSVNKSFPGFWEGLKDLNFDWI